MKFPYTRMRRLRKNSKIRSLVKETTLSKDDLIYPVFVKEGIKTKEKIPKMPGQYRYSVDELIDEAKKLEEKGLKAILVFGIPKKKDKYGSSAYDPNGIVQKSVKLLKEETDLVVITDVCLCQYTEHGHCGIVKNKKIVNDETLKYLSKVALSHAEAGADVVAPSDMMDGRVKAIREELEKNGFDDVIIMSYSAKYASSFYEPFRSAVYSSPAFGDRSTYQMDPPNSLEALREVKLDIDEGADIVMVKPALPYLDIIRLVKDTFGVPTAAYNVSGEYSMIKAAIDANYLSNKVIIETLLSIKRAGADLIITHFAPEIVEEI